MRDLNHPKVKPFTREIGASLGIDPKFLDFVFAKTRPECFRYWVEDVDGGWTCYVPVEFDVVYPLWCTNADQTLILVKGSKVTFGAGWHDNPEMEIISETSQGLLTHLLNQMAESEATDEELIQAAEFSGYRFLDELLKFMDEATPEASSWSESMAKFIAEIDAKSQS